MKTNKLHILLLAFISMFFSACVDIEVSTILNADGSLDRIVEVNSDSELENYDDLPFPIDSSWQIDYKVDTTLKSKQHIYVFKKHYASAEELNKDYNNVVNGLSRFNRKVVVNKKFRWFYTYISYEEKYEKIARGDYRPFDQYLSDIEKEAREFKYGDSLENIDASEKKRIDKSLKEIDEKFETWFEDNMKEEVILAIEQDIADNNVQGVKDVDIRANADSIYQIIDSLDAKKMKVALYESLNRLLRTDEFDKVKNAENTKIEELEKAIEDIIPQTGFRYHLQAPGLLLDANAEIIKGNQLTWQFEPVEAYFVETKHSAESRIINVWAFWASGVAVLLIILLLLLPVFRRK